MNLCIVALGWVITINWESYSDIGKVTLGCWWLFLFITSAIHPAPPLEKIKISTVIPIIFLRFFRMLKMLLN